MQHSEHVLIALVCDSGCRKLVDWTHGTRLSTENRCNDHGHLLFIERATVEEVGEFYDDK